MTTETTAVKQQIYQLIETLPGERLPDILRLLSQFLQKAKPASPSDTAPVYQIHQYAVDTGISDLATQHDHYIYGTAKDNG